MSEDDIPQTDAEDQMEVPQPRAEFDGEGVDIRFRHDENKIFCLKTQLGKEKEVARALLARAKKFNVPILSVLCPAELRGYVFVESTDLNELQRGVRGVTYARSFVQKNYEVRDEEGNVMRTRQGKVITESKPAIVDFSEVRHYLTPVSAVAKIEIGDLVEIVGGAFQGERGKVARVDEGREEITVELVEALVPIPITVRGESVRVLEKKE